MFDLLCNCCLKHDVTIWRVRVACRVSKAKCARTHAHARTRTHTEVCSIYCFSTAKMIRERATILRYAYIVCLVSCSDTVFVRQGINVFTQESSSRCACMWLGLKLCAPRNKKTSRNLQHSCNLRCFWAYRNLNVYKYIVKKDRKVETFGNDCLELRKSEVSAAVLRMQNRIPERSWNNGVIFLTEVCGSDFTRCVKYKLSRRPGMSMASSTVYVWSSRPIQMPETWVSQHASSENNL